jgi:hypothetical protein
VEIKTIKGGAFQEKLMNNFSFNGNYIDLIILVIFIYFISEAWTYGFWIIIADFISFFLSLITALWVIPTLGNFLEVIFH